MGKVWNEPGRQRPGIYGKYGKVWKSMGKVWNGFGASERGQLMATGAVHDKGELKAKCEDSGKYGKVWKKYGMNME